MRSAIGFGMLVTAAVVTLEVATGIPRNMLDSAAAKIAGTPLAVAGTAGTSTSVETPESNASDNVTGVDQTLTTLDLIPAIARTIAIADDTPVPAAVAARPLNSSDLDQQPAASPSIAPAVPPPQPPSASLALGTAPVDAAQLDTPTTGTKIDGMVSQVAPGATPKTATTKGVPIKPSARIAAAVKKPENKTLKTGTKTTVATHRSARGLDLPRTAPQRVGGQQTGTNKRTWVTVHRGGQASVIGVPGPPLKAATR